MKINLRSILLVAILFFGLFLRLYQLDKIPASLFGDEIDVGYQAWSLGTTGKDYMGNTLPTFLQSFSEWRTPLLSYVLSPVLAIFGPSTLSVRIPVAIMGVINIYLIFLLFRKLFPKYKNAALMSAFILCVSPWHIHFSRIAFDSTLLLNLYLLASILILNSKFALSLPVLMLTLYTYPTANIFTPMFIIFSFLIFRPKFNLVKNVLPYLLAVVMLVPISLNIISGSASGRFSGISIFADPKITESIVTTRTESWIVGGALEPIFHNKLFAYTAVFANQYISAFSAKFLFTDGDPNFRHSVGEYGEFFLFFAPLLAVGFYSLLSRLKDPKAKFILVWLIFAPIPSALTQGGGSHAIRLITMLPPLVIMYALALRDIISYLKNYINVNILYVVFSVVCLISLVFYWHRYSSHYKFLSFRNWQYGYEQTFGKLSQINQPGKVYINNTYEPSLLKFLFYTKYPPKDFIKDFKSDKTITDLVPGFSGFNLTDKYYFGQLNSNFSLDKLLQVGDIYIAAQRIEIPGDQDWSKEPQTNFNTLGVTYDAFGAPLFTIVEKK